MSNAGLRKVEGQKQGEQLVNIRLTGSQMFIVSAAINAFQAQKEGEIRERNYILNALEISGYSRLEIAKVQDWYSDSISELKEQGKAFDAKAIELEKQFVERMNQTLNGDDTDGRTKVVLKVKHLTRIRQCIEDNNRWMGVLPFLVEAVFDAMDQAEPYQEPVDKDKPVTHN